MPDKFVGSQTGVRTADQTKTLVTLNCDNGGGDLYLANNAGTWTIAARAVESTHCGLWMGGSGQFGLLTLRNSKGKDTVNLGNGETGDLYLRNADGQFTVALRAVENDTAGIWVGGSGQNGHIVVRNAAGTNQIHLDGKAGDIVLANADCAEEFEVVEDVPAGTVMAIADDGRLRSSDEPYDRRVAGIVSGAGDTKPGIVL